MPPKPRILCLHGGGTSAEIFSLQSRALIRALAPHFVLVFADAPFLCGPGPGVVPVYADCGPFRRWLRYRAEHADVGAEAVVDEIARGLRAVVEGREGVVGMAGSGRAVGGREGAKEKKGEREEQGEWVGLLGFSQGAKLAASLLLEQQLREEEEEEKATTNDDANDAPTRTDDPDDPLAFLPRFRFAILCAGRAPLACLSPRSAHRSTVPPSTVTEYWSADGVTPRAVEALPERLKLRRPTVHVHGLQDEGLVHHRRLRDECCVASTATLVEWEGDHRMPLKAPDVDRVVRAMVAVAKETGVEVGSG